MILTPEQEVVFSKAVTMFACCMGIDEDSAREMLVDTIEKAQPRLIAEQLAKAAAVLSSGNFTPAPVLEHAPTVRISDVIKLKPRVDAAKGKLQAWGFWWKVSDVRMKGPHDPHPEWILRSIAAQPRIMGKKQVELLTIKKGHDPNYAVVQVCVHPKEFVYKEWKE